MLGPVLDLFDRALNLAARHGDGASDLGDEDAAQPLLVLFERLVQLRKAVVAELEVARPVRRVERPARRPHRAPHVRDRAVGRLPGDFLAARVDHVKFRAAAGDLQFTVDEHPLFTGQHARLSLHTRHGRQLYNSWPKCQPFCLIPTA
jgi:hypothetical protein